MYLLISQQIIALLDCKIARIIRLSYRGFLAITSTVFLDKMDRKAIIINMKNIA